MKVIRKKGIENVRLVHNKKLFWIIIILGILLIAVIIFMVINSKNDDSTNNGPENECQTDNDCIKVSTGCCSCNMGGEEKCVSKNEEQKYNDILKNCSDERIICIAMYNCNIESCVCINNKCVAS